MAFSEYTPNINNLLYAHPNVLGNQVEAPVVGNDSNHIYALLTDRREAIKLALIILFSIVYVSFKELGKDYVLSFSLNLGILGIYVSILFIAIYSLVKISEYFQAHNLT